MCVLGSGAGGRQTDLLAHLLLFSVLGMEMEFNDSGSEPTLPLCEQLCEGPKGMA